MKENIQKFRRFPSGIQGTQWKRAGVRLLILLALLFAGTMSAYASEGGSDALAFSVQLDNTFGVDFAFCAAYGHDGKMLAVSSIPVTAAEQRVQLSCGRDETGSVKIFTLDGAFRPTGAAQIPDWRRLSDSKVMIAYFAVAENSDVDAVSSASVISAGDPRGYPKFVADVIAERTAGTLFSIRTETKYPGVYNTLADYARNEKDSGTRPTITSLIENFDDYDVFFVGYPIWWYTLPQVMLSFFEEYDFAGKTIIPFCTHYGSQSGGTFERIAELEPDAVVKDGLYLHQNEVAGAEDRILSWLDGLGYTAHTADGVPVLTLNNGVQIPQLGLGTQIQRLEGDSSESGRTLLNQTSHDAVVAALQAGYRHLDTAHGYYNERGVGQGIIDSGVPREEIWVTSKLWPSEYGEGVTARAIDAMLERLQLDYLDCIYLHHPAGDYIGAWRDLEAAYHAGKVRTLGISNFDNWPEAFQAIMDAAEVKPQLLQIECHPFAQRLETRELAARYDLQIECWYPLGHADPELLQNETLTRIAQTHGKSIVQIILRWHMQEGFCAVPGSTNPAHIQENIDIFDFVLTDSEMEQIRALDRGESGRHFNIDYQRMGNFFLSLNE